MNWPGFTCNSQLTKYVTIIVPVKDCMVATFETPLSVLIIDIGGETGGGRWGFSPSFFYEGGANEIFCEKTYYNNDSILYYKVNF